MTDEQLEPFTEVADVMQFVMAHQLSEKAWQAEWTLEAIERLQAENDLLRDEIDRLVPYERAVHALQDAMFPVGDLA